MAPTVLGARRARTPYRQLRPVRTMLARCALRVVRDDEGLRAGRHGDLADRVRRVPGDEGEERGAMSAALRSPSPPTPGLTLTLSPPPWPATEVIMEMRQPFGPPWRLLLVRDDCGSVVAMVPIYSAALLRA